MTVGVIDYGAGNIRSVVNACRHLGYDASTVSKPGELKDFDSIILPGVGSFGDSMEKLRNFSFKDLVDDGVPFLGLCLGIQVLFEESEESPDIKGMGLLEGRCIRFQGVKVPHMGWNSIEKVRDIPLLEGIDGGFYYFVHSYYAVPADQCIVAATTDYGGVEFPSIVSRDNLHATQFHPEKSGEQGLMILKNFLESSR